MNTLCSSSTRPQQSLPKISIGLPVYNGEKYLKKVLNSLIKQTFSNFEIIISDNASTDSTSAICKEFVKKDSRISYFRQEKNMGSAWNFNFVLEQANFEYFMWAASDDIRHHLFLEKTIKKIINNHAVGGMSKARFFDSEDDADRFFRTLILKIRYSLKPDDIVPLNGTYENKVKKFLRKSRAWLVYSIFYTEILKKCMIKKEFVGTGMAMVLNVLRYGDIVVVDEILTEFYSGGISKKGILAYSKQFNKRALGIIFPYYPFTSWCLKNLGTRLFIKNIDYFVKLNVWGVFLLVMDVIRLFYKRFVRID